MKWPLVVLAVALIAACSAATLRQAEPPRIRCVALGAVPGDVWWVYACTFTGSDSLPPLPDVGDVTAGVQ